MNDISSLFRFYTYIAGDWDGDRDLINLLYALNDSNRNPVRFFDAHEMKQARDSSLACTVKKSLKDRLDASGTFVLIVGENTERLTKGGCQYCGSYNAYTHSCARQHAVDYRSFVEYECEYARDNNLRVIVLYNARVVDRFKCPEVLRFTGVHVAAKTAQSAVAEGWDIPMIESVMPRR